MNPKAITQAQGRLDRARSAVEAMKAANNPAQVEDQWARFLLAAAGIYSKLLQGAKGNAKSETWFGQKTHERRTDPLLRYLHHARNSEEHGIEEITKRTSSHVKLHPGAAAFFRTDGKHIWDAVPWSGRVEFPHDKVRLVPIHDSRFPRDRFDPPETHLGQAVTDHSPAAVASLGLAYFEQMLLEASALLS
jgi:hypothetical protein